MGDYLRSCIYPADRRTEKYGPDSCFADLELRECIFCAGRLGDLKSDLKRPGNFGLYTDVFGYYSGTASGKTKESIVFSEKLRYY